MRVDTGLTKNIIQTNKNVEKANENYKNMMETENILNTLML